MDNPHEAKRADQIGGRDKTPEEIAAISAPTGPLMFVPDHTAGERRAQALSLAIQSFDKPLRDVSPAMFIGRAVSFETYLTTGKAPDDPVKPVELAGSRAYVESDDGTFRSV
jgi:hypothetical protein